MTTPQGPEDRNDNRDSTGASDSSSVNPYSSGDSQQGSGFGTPSDAGSNNTGATSAFNPQAPNPQAPQNGFGAAPSYGSNGFGTQAFGNGANGFDPNAHSAFGYNQGGFAQYPAAQQPNHGTNQDSFLKALFDFSFTKYVTPSVVKAIYILLTVLVALFSIVGLFLILAALTEDAGIFIFIIGLPVIVVGALVTLAFYRVGLEVAVSLIRTSQSVQSIDQRQAQQEQQGNSGYTYGG